MQSLYSFRIPRPIISNIYLMAWKANLKGITIYRDGSRFPILSNEGELTDFQKEKSKQYKIANNKCEEELVNGDEIIKFDDGSLTTVYHFMKNSEVAIEEVLENSKFENVEKA